MLPLEKWLVLGVIRNRILPGSRSEKSFPTRQQTVKNNFAVRGVPIYERSPCNPLLLYGRTRYISDDFVLFSGDGSAHSTEFQDIDSVTRVSLCAPLSQVRKRSTKLIAALLLVFGTQRRQPFSLLELYTGCYMRNYRNSFRLRTFRQIWDRAFYWISRNISLSGSIRAITILQL